MTPIPPITPYLFVSNAAAAIEFYKNGFGAVQEGEVHKMPGTDKIMHARLLINGSLIMIADEFSQGGDKSETPDALGGSPIMLALNLEDVQTFWDTAVAAGATVTMPLALQFWGDKYGQMTDPFGHKWSLSQTVTQMSGAEMQDAASAMLAEKGTLMGTPD